MNKVFVIILICSSASFGQTKRVTFTVEKPKKQEETAVKAIPPKAQEYEPAFIVVENEPIFLSGDLTQYIQSHISYPDSARTNNIQGKVFVQFVINEFGNVVDARVVRGVHPLLDVEALRVILNLPKFTPGSQSGKKVRVQRTLPVEFIIPKQ